MRKWWKKIEVLAGGLMGLAGLVSQIHAQSGMPGPDGGVFPGAPQPPPGPDFPNASAPPSEPVSPFSLTNDGSPNAWTDGGPTSGSGYRFSLRSEFINWWIPKLNLPVPLVTSTSARYSRRTARLNSCEKGGRRHSSRSGVKPAASAC